MGSQTKPGHLLFANQIAGPMTFTFFNVLGIEKKKFVKIIQSNGGEVVEYDDRDRFTIVLSEKNKDANGEIRFNLKYIKDCKDRNEILPLESYRLDKSVNVGCHYSKPLDSTSCLFVKLMRRRCRKHKTASDDKSNGAGVTCDEAALKKQLKFIKKRIRVERQPQVKREPETPERSMRESQQDQSLEAETCYSQSLLRRKANGRAPLKGVKKKPRTKGKSRAFRGGSRRLRARH